jgi:hypothetical protein
MVAAFAGISYHRISLIGSIGFKVVYGSIGFIFLLVPSFFNGIWGIRTKLLLSDDHKLG